MKIGIDFDNTLAIYDDVFAKYGRDMRLLPSGFAGDKKQARTLIREMVSGNDRWTELQAHVYGAGMAHARLAPGAMSFLERCASEEVEVAIVSHKTRRAVADPNVDLREAARAWLQASGLVPRLHERIPALDVYFEDTQADKIARLTEIGCSWFIDDLEEIFDHPDFPPHVGRILIGPSAGPSRGDSVHIVTDWLQVQMAIFGA